MIALAAQPTEENKLLRLHLGDASRALAEGLRGVETVAKYRRRFKALQEMRKPVEPFWRDVRDNLDPAGTSPFLDGHDGKTTVIPDDSKILDNTPRKMAQTAADGLHGGLSNPAANWFGGYIGNYDQYDSEASAVVKKFVQMSQECVRDKLAGSNFYSVLHPLYKDVLDYGTALMMGGVNPDTLVRFFHHKPGSFWIAPNNERVIDTVCIKHTLRAYDIADTYGIENCPSSVREALKLAGDPDRRFVIIQFIQPWRGKRTFFGEAIPNPRGYQYEDVRFVEGTRDDEPLLYRDGYRTKPFIVARWSDVGDDVYPLSCPGIDALPDIKQLYKVTEDYNLAVEWVVNPTLSYDSQSAPEMKKIRPGDIIPRASGAKDAGVQALVPPVFNIAAAFQERARLIECISATLYNREIMMISGRAMQNHQMTATEAQLLDQEKSAVMGPIVVRMGNDVLIPALDMTFDILTQEWVLLPQAPEEIRGQEIKHYFTSELAITQRQAEMSRINQFDQWVAAVAQQRPEVWDFVNMEQRIRLFEKLDIIPPNLLRTPEEIQQANAARAQAAQEQQRMLALREGSEIARNLGGASTAPDTVMGNMVGAGNASE